MELSLWAHIEDTWSVPSALSRTFAHSCGAKAVQERKPSCKQLLHPRITAAQGCSAAIHGWISPLHWWTVEAQKSPTLPASPSWRCSGFSRAAIRPDARRTGACCAAQSVPGFSRAGEQTKKQTAEVTEMGRGWRTGRELNYFHESRRCFAQHAGHGDILHRFHQGASSGELYSNQSGAALEQWGLHGRDLLLWFMALHSSAFPGTLEAVGTS